MNRYQNWMTYSFNNSLMIQKLSSLDNLSLHFDIKDLKNLDYHSALKYNASVMRDSFNEPFDVLLSGGIDSEVVVRTFKELGITHNTFIFRYEDNLNIRDINSSIQICEALAIPYKIIDFNLTKFYQSNESVDLYNNTFVPNLTSLSRIKWLDFLDNIPVFGEGEPYWGRDNRADYSQKSSWSWYLSERELFISLNHNYIKRPIVGEWYQFTPEVNHGFFNDAMIAELLDDKIKGKQGTLTTRLALHRKFWPSIKEKSKLTGYEGPRGKPLENAPKIFEKFYFENKIFEQPNPKNKYTVSEFTDIFKKRKI